MSFAFRVGDESWETVDGANIRTILSFDEVFDVSPVTYPAYPATDVSIRERLLAEGLGTSQLEAAILYAGRRGMQPEDLALIQEYIRILRFLIDGPAQPNGESEVPQDGPRVRSLNQIMRRLHVLELEQSIEETIQ